MNTRRTITLIIASVVAICAPITVGEPDVKVDGKCVWIEGIEPYRVREPLFEAVRIVLSHRGATYSPEYIQGISGAAFRIAGICPCAPTSSFAMKAQELPALLGYAVETLVCEGGCWERGETNAAGRLAKMAKKGVLPDADDIAEPELRELRNRLQVLIDRTKEELNQGRPVVFWNAFTAAEFDVVCGYDDEKKVFLGFGSYSGKPGKYAEAPETRSIMTALVGGCPTAILIGNRIADVNLRDIEIAALREAVEHAYSEGGALTEGLRCYDAWVEKWRKPDSKRGIGDAYCYGVYRDTHRAAARFLREITPNYPAAAASLKKAADSFQAEGEVLRKAEKLLWWNSPVGPDVSRNKRAAKALQEARNHYAAGIKGIEEALAQIDSRAEH